MTKQMSRLNTTDTKNIRDIEQYCTQCISSRSKFDSRRATCTLRGTFLFRQYIPSKPEKYGIKSELSVAARLANALKVEIYMSKEANEKKASNLGSKVVLDLSEAYKKVAPVQPTIIFSQVNFRKGTIAEKTDVSCY